MKRNNFIRPETINILGDPQKIKLHTETPQTDSSSNGETFWNKMRPSTQKVLHFIKQGLEYVKDNVVPIIVAVTGLISAWNNFRYNEQNRRCTA